MTKESKLQPKCYENRIWNVINCYNSWINATLEDCAALENNQMIPSTKKKFPLQLFGKVEFWTPTAFIIHVVTEKQKRAIIRDAIKFTEIFLLILKTSLPSKKHCNDFHFNLPVRNYQYPYSSHSNYYLIKKPCKSSFADVLFTIVFNLNRNINNGTVSKKNFPKYIF